VAGFVGSITHTAGHCAAAVARRTAVAALGAERVSALHPEVAARVCRAAERAAFGRRDDGLGALIVFRAKESVFKACSLHIGRLLDFDDVAVPLRPATGGFVAELALDVPPLFGERRVAGRFSRCDGLVPVAIVHEHATA
jgi:4'-phosphopantetheinyl transferase EntD